MKIYTEALKINPVPIAGDLVTLNSILHLRQTILSYFTKSCIP